MDKRWVKFPEVLFFQEGPGVRNTQYTSEGVKLLNVANLVNGKVDISNSDRFISRDEAYGKYKHFLCDNGDFIVASSGIKVEYIDKKMGFIDKSMLPLCMNTSTVRFKVLNSKELNIRYFMYYLKSRHFKLQLAKQITGSAQLNYGPSHLKDMCLPIVDIYIQNNIVEILDKIQSMINICEAKIEKLDILVRARFVELFGDIKNTKSKFKTRKLGEVAIIGSSHRVFTTEFVDNGIPFYRGTEISDLSKGVKPNCMYYISEEHYNRISSDNTKPKIGDLLMPSICNKGQVWMVDTNEPFYYKDGRVLCISPNRDIFNTRYLEHFMREKTQEEYAKLGSGSTFAEFKIFLLKYIDILVPPIELQNQFAIFVNHVNKSKVEVKRALDKAQLLFDSLMQKYFG